MLQLKNIKKSYKTGDFKQVVLDGISLNFKDSEFVSILGPSGSGKTTLLNIIGGLDQYDSGDLIINGMSTKKFKDKNWDSYRNNSIGFIFQSYNLISHMSILSNVELCMTLSGVSKKERKKRAIDALNKVGLKSHIHKKPNQLSGGQMQRVAIARALVNNPDIILADEPTGALDSKTSIQIMELIKEISKDKLVIMVTHNPELAKSYSTRIIELKDGNVINDTEENTEKEEKSDYKLKKTSMNFLTALNLSFNNIMTKKGRTLITAFASSIGIIGISLILSLSNGFQIQIDKYEKDTLSQAPIVISEQSMDTNAITKSRDDKLKEFTDEKKIYAEKTAEKMIHKNNITNDYMNYIEKIDSNLIGGVAYRSLASLNLLTKKDDKVVMVDTTLSTAQIPINLDGSKSVVMDDNFEVIEGKYAENKEELMLLVDTKNRVDSMVLKALGIDSDKLNFKDIIGKEFKVILNNDYYENTGFNYIPKQNLEELYNSDNSITLKIVGIVRGKEGSGFAKLSGSGLTYTKSLIDYVIEQNKNSEIVKQQQDSNYNVITLEKYNLDSEDGINSKNQTLAYLGDDVPPMMLQIYPKDFDSKKKIVKYLDKYNKEKNEKDKIIYLDQSELITSLSGNIMNAITIVLVAFSGISLVVSSIMIGIITYISVLERTKEIGILRAIGARKKDIRRVFSAETFIIGLSSGILGILISQLLTIPINMIIEKLTDLSDVAKLNIVHAIVLVTISVILTVIGGSIPSKLASKKDPVEALRTE